MPRYQYACTVCDERLEVVQRFTDEPLTQCPTCGGRLRKVYSAVGIVFKGSGFYRTDSREAAKSGVGSSSNGSSDASAPKSDSTPSTTSAAPTASKTTPTTSSTSN